MAILILEGFMDLQNITELMSPLADPEKRSEILELIAFIFSTLQDWLDVYNNVSSHCWGDGRTSLRSSKFLVTDAAAYLLLL